MQAVIELCDELRIQSCKIEVHSPTLDMAGFHIWRVHRNADADAEIGMAN